MYVEVFSIGNWLTQAAAFAPLLGTLIVGLVIQTKKDLRQNCRKSFSRQVPKVGLEPTLGVNRTGF